MPMLQISVKPNSKHQAIEILDDGSLVIRLKSSPVDGKANAELIALLAKQFAVPKSSVRIKSGQTSRRKLVEVDNP
jgi:uncharacterized protein (TIGR00251 family)